MTTASTLLASTLRAPKPDARLIPWFESMWRA
jgi:hypothetical protein